MKRAVVLIMILLCAVTAVCRAETDLIGTWQLDAVTYKRRTYSPERLRTEGMICLFEDGTSAVLLNGGVKALPWTETDDGRLLMGDPQKTNVELEIKDGRLYTDMNGYGLSFVKKSDGALPEKTQADGAGAFAGTWTLSRAYIGGRMYDAAFLPYIGAGMTFIITTDGRTAHLDYTGPGSAVTWQTAAAFGDGDLMLEDSNVFESGIALMDSGEIGITMGSDMLLLTKEQTQR